MGMTVNLPLDTQEYIESQARQTGMDASQYAASLLRRAVLRERYDRVFGPVQQGFEAMELSEDEELALIEMAREEAWLERREG